MGQYGNQPDFGTIVTSVDIVGAGEFPPSAIYVGKTDNGNPCRLTVIPAGNNGVQIDINGISQGTFLPIVITKVVDYENIDKQNILLYR
jgi:hypothetical protein